MQNPSLPVGTGERSNLLDALRGFALLGVMMDNLFGFSGWAFLPQPAKESLSTWTSDGIIGMLEQVFINGKFYSLFSLLFGIGFSYGNYGNTTAQLLFQLNGAH